MPLDFDVGTMRRALPNQMAQDFGANPDAAVLRYGRIQTRARYIVEPVILRGELLRYLDIQHMESSVAKFYARQLLQALLNRKANHNSQGNFDP